MQPLTCLMMQQVVPQRPLVTHTRLPQRNQQRRRHAVRGRTRRFRSGRLCSGQFRSGRLRGPGVALDECDARLIDGKESEGARVLVDEDEEGERHVIARRERLARGQREGRGLRGWAGSVRKAYAGSESQEAARMSLVVRCSACIAAAPAAPPRVPAGIRPRAPRTARSGCSRRWHSSPPHMLVRRAARV